MVTITATTRRWYGRTALIAVLGLIAAQASLAAHLHLDVVDDGACVICAQGGQDGAAASVSVEPIADAFQAVQLGKPRVAPRPDGDLTPYAPRDPPHSGC